MADVKEAFELCKVFSKDTIVGMEHHCSEDVVILTSADRGVLVYNLQDQKVVSSWSVKQKQKPTCGAVFNTSSQKYTMVLDKTEVCSWSDDLEDLQKCQTTQLEKPVFKIQSFPSASRDPVVVFEDGSTSVLSQCMAAERKRRPKKKKGSTNHKLLWSGVLERNKDSPDVVLVVSQDGGEYRLTLSQPGSVHSTDSGASCSCELLPPTQDAELLTCCLQESGPTFISYWSDGSLCSSDLGRLSTNLLHADNTTVRCLCIQHLTSFLPSQPSKKRDALAMASIDSSHVCVCGRSKIEGEWKDVLTIWNTKYGTVQAWLPMTDTKRDASSPSSPCPLSRGADHTLCTRNFICVALHQRVVVCPYTVEASSLASSLGKLAATARFSNKEVTKPGLMVTPKLAKPGEAMQSWSEQILGQDSEEQKALERLTNPQLTPSLETFTAELEDYMQKKRVGVDRIDVKNKCNKEKGTAKRKHGDGDEGQTAMAGIPQHFVTRVLARCLSETAFWPKQSVSALLRSKCVPGSSSAVLIKTLIERSEAGLLRDCFKNIKGIPATSVVASLQFFLRLDDLELRNQLGSKTATKEPDDSELPVSRLKAQSLCVILDYPVNDVFLQDSLKKLDFKDVILLVRILLALIQSGLNNFRQEWGRNLQYTKVFDWANLLLGAHYTQLVLMPDAHELVVTFHQTVHAQIQVYEKLQSLEGFLDQCKTRQPLPSADQLGLYSIEMVDL